MAHIISSPTTLKTSSHLEQGAGTYYSGTQAWNYRVCVSVSPSYRSVCSCLCVCLSPTEIGLAIIVLPIWWKHYSFDVILYHISLWQAIREGDELFFHLRGRETERDALLLLLCWGLLRSLWDAASVHKTDIQMISSGQPGRSFALHRHEETSESLINFRIINLWPLVDESWACRESLFNLWIHTNVFVRRA